MNINDISSNLFQFEKFCSTDEGFCLLKDEFEKMALGPLKFEDLIFLENGYLLSSCCQRRKNDQIS